MVDKDNVYIYVVVGWIWSRILLSYCKENCALAKVYGGCAVILFRNIR